MPGHDIIVIGASAGGLKALTAVIGNLPAAIDASIFIVQHISPERRSVLPEILDDISALPVTHPRDGERIARGRVFVAPPDHHLLIEPERVRLLRGPRENRFRPAIDTLFRSAARAYGPRVVGVVLTGYLDDGTIGLQAIKRRGGVTVVQDPAEAEYPSMPASALRYAAVDHSLPIAKIPALLVRLSRETPGPGRAADPSGEMETETRIAEQQMDTRQLIASVDAIGTRTYFTCPNCNGSLWQIGEAEPLRFRCHLGHSFTDASLLAEQTNSLEGALLSAVRLMEEKAMMTRRMAERRRAMNLPEAAEPYARYAEQLEQEIAHLRLLLTSGNATRHFLSDSVANGDDGAP